MMNFIKEVFRGQTIYRILMHRSLRRKTASWKGKVVDFAGGGSAYYYRFLPQEAELVRTNYFEGKDIDQVVDLNKKLPFEDESVDVGLFFNAIYILESPLETLREMRRVLAPGGKLYIVSPFIANEMPQPHDYLRYTAEGLERLFREAGFSEFKVERFGERFSAGAYLLHSFFLFNFVRFFAYSLALLLDKLVPARVKKSHPSPLGYLCILQK